MPDSVIEVKTSKLTLLSMHGHILVGGPEPEGPADVTCAQLSPEQARQVFAVADRLNIPHKRGIFGDSKRTAHHGANW